MFDSEDKNMMSFTIKNYKLPLGLSTRFYKNVENEMFEVAGPFGKGLEPDINGGIHIAFAGGTGALTFLDLAA